MSYSKISLNKLYKMNIKKFPYISKLPKKSRDFFCTAEYLWEIMENTSLDNSPILIEYSKVIENTLNLKIKLPLKNWIESRGKKIKTGPNKNDINKFHKMSLGNYPYIFKEDIFSVFTIETMNEEYLDIICNKIGPKLLKIIYIRNSSAHTAMASIEKVHQMRNLLFEDKLLIQTCYLP